MARIFRHTFTKRTKNGGRVQQKCRKWYIEYRDASDIRRRVPGYTDKRATEQLAAELERRAAREQAGLIDPAAEHRRRPLSDHLDDWRQSLLDRNATAEYATLSDGRVRTTFSGIKAIRWDDIDAGRIAAYLADRRASGLSIETTNHYIRRIRQFCRWMVVAGRAASSPAASLRLLNSRTDRRHDRRAFLPDELRRLLETTHRSTRPCVLTGPERAMLYRLAVETGLRARELRSLTPSSFDLDADPPTVSVHAAYSKHRRDDVLPIRPELAADLARYLAGRDAHSPVFADLPKMTARMLRADLHEAGISYRDDDGRVADFHALRHTFITNLVRGGVHPKVAQGLARHSTISLTMDRYTHTVIADLASALQVLPTTAGIGDDAATDATGTDG